MHKFIHAYSWKVSASSPEMTSSSASGRLQMAFTLPLPTSPSKNDRFGKSQKVRELATKKFTTM